MKIVIYGECDLYGSGAWCYYETLSDMQNEVSFFSPVSLLKKYETSFFLKIIRKIRKGSVLRKHQRKHQHEFLKKILEFKPDIVIVLKGLMIDGSTVSKIKESGSWTVLINHDDFFSAFKYNTSNILLKALPYYNYIFCTKEINVEEIRKYNKNTELFMFAYYPRIHYPPTYNIADQERWESDIVFVGNTYPLRIQQLEYLITHINYPLNLKIYGPNWEKKTGAFSPLWKYIQKRSLGPEEMRKAIYYSKISLGFLCKENRDDYTQRSFEVPAIKGTLLAERTKRHLSFYSEGEEAEFFDSDNFEELLEKTVKLLKNDQLRKQLSEQGHIRVKASNHTYKDRLERLLYLYTIRIN
jgi:spore maturation protein CgeB